MIPIRDSQKAKNRPIVNHVLIVVNVLVFLLEISRGSGMDAFILEWGLVPARYTTDMQASFLQLLLTPISCMFLHGGWMHIIGNMWVLWIFGDNIEDAMGSKPYLIFYLVCGLIAAFSHFIVEPSSTIPVVGASGAIAGVMGAYFALYPGSRILAFFPPMFIFEVPAWLFLGFWLLIQLFSAFGGSNAGIAWWAHIGGFAAGFVLIRLWVRLPEGHFSRKLQEAKEEKARANPVENLQVLRPLPLDDSADLYADIFLTPREAFSGCTMEVNIPWGFHARLYKVNIMPETRDGQKLRMRGLGRKGNDGNAGDLILTARILDP